MPDNFDKRRKAYRDKFRSETDCAVPLVRRGASIGPRYPKDSPTGGCPPPLLVWTFRINCVQRGYKVPDPRARAALYDWLPMRRFAGVTTAAGVILDETSILGIRRLLEKHQRTALVFSTTNAHLSERGLFVGRRAIVDGTIIAAPSSTKNAKKGHDLPMHLMRKGKQWYFGMKVRTGTDADSGRVHTVEAMGANMPDVNLLGQSLYSTEAGPRGGSAHRSKEFEAEAEAIEIALNVNCRSYKHRPLTKAQRACSRRRPRMGITGEPPPLTIHQMGDNRLRDSQ